MYNSECKLGKVVWVGPVPSKTYGETICRVVLYNEEYIAEQYNARDKDLHNPFTKQLVEKKYPWSNLDDDPVMRADVFEHVFSLYYKPETE
jgi:hypothetical protein